MTVTTTETASSQAPKALPLIWASLRSRSRALMESALASVAVNLLALGTSLYSMQVYDRVIPSHGLQTLVVLTVGAGLSVLLEWLLKHLRARLADDMATSVDEQLSERFFERAMGIRMEARPNAIGSLASQVKSFELVRGILASTSLFALTDVPFAVFFVAMIFALGGVIGWIPLMVLPGTLLAGWIFQSLIRRHAKSSQGASHKKAGLLVEALDGAESIKALGAEAAMQNRWRNLVLESSQADEDVRRLTAISQNFTVAAQQLSYVALIGAGAWLAAKQELTMGALLACSILSNRALAPIVQLPSVMMQWAHARVAIDGLDRLLALPNEASETAHQVLAGVQTGAVSLRGVRFLYGQRPALEAERLDVRPGDRIGVIGPIGSGKSTLLKVASGLYRPQQGQVLLADLDLSLIQPQVLRASIGYLPQDYRLISGTLRQNLCLGIDDPGDEVVLEASRRSGLLPLITGQPKGLELEISEGGRGVSGGQRQLIGLTRLVLSKPKLWLLDEPTGAMDADHEGRVMALLQGQLGATDCAIVSTHKTALLPLFNRLWVVQNGRVVLDGPRDDVLARLSGKGAA
jgi:ATP-binding cassette, subfamily C, bacterial LapB